MKERRLQGETTDNQNLSLWDRMESVATRISLPSLKAEERRRHTRHQVRENTISVSFSSQNALARFYIKDLSTGGLFVKTNERPEMKSLISLRLQVESSANQAQEDFLLTARVVRHDADGIGLMVAETDLESRQRLEELVKAVAQSERILAKADIKKSVFERISSRKHDLHQKKKLIRRQTITWMGVAALLGINIAIIPIEVTEIKESLLSSSSKQNLPSIQIKVDREPKASAKTLSISVTKGLIEEPIQLKDLPEALRKTIEGANNLASEPRRSKTAPDSRVRLR